MPVAPLAIRTSAVHSASSPWRPERGPQTARKPAGGFIDCPVDVLTLPWWVYQQGAIGLSTLRVWFGTLELVEKRCGAAPNAPVHYSAEELRRLLRVPRLAPVTAAVQQLEALGLLAWSPQAIGVLPHAAVVQEALAQDGYQRLRAQCAGGRRWVPVPRRLLVWLAQEGQAGLIATALGVLLRCMRYKARQCVAGGRVAAPWIASVFGVAERTVQRAMQTLQHCGWLARLAVQPERERPHGRYTVINLAWQRPSATERARRPREADAPPAVPVTAPCPNMSPLQGAACQRMSPMAAHTTSVTFGNTGTCDDSPPVFFQPFQEEDQDPEPTGRGPAGAVPQEQQPQVHGTAIRPSSCDDEDVTEDAYTAATARLVTAGNDPAFLMRPVVLAEVQRARQTASQRPVAASQASGELAEPCRVPTACPATPQTPQAPASVPPACARPPIPLPPTLRDVTLADLSDVGRLLALHQQAIARGWLRGGEAERLNVVAAAVHAQRVGQAPCRLFVALLRDQRWEVITQEDEDQARRLLREHRDGPCRRSAAPTAEPEVPLPDDARFVLLAEQVLRQAGWPGDLFLAVQMQYPTWTRARWDQAQEALAQWRRQHAHTRQQGSLDTMAIPWEDTEAEEAEDE